MNPLDETIELTPEVLMLRNNYDDGYSYRQRRSLDWTENYELYRDKVTINRLTQTQSVNIPMMKGQISSMLSNIDDMPVIYFENLDNDKQAELFKNEYWKDTVVKNKMELQDMVDKKQALLFGRTFDQWQVKDGRIVMTVQDPEDILVSRYTNPFDIHSSRYLIHINIFVPLSSLKKNKDYDQEALGEIEEYFKSQYGILKISKNAKALADKNKKLQDMGVQNVESPVLGETYVELAMHFVYRDFDYDEEGKETEIPTQIYLYVLAEGQKTLMKKPLEQVIGVTKDHFWRNHYPYNSWATDIERQDFWSDAPADVIRTPNKVLNANISQSVVNRTLRNYGMNYYNSNLEGFVPPTITPSPGAWIGLPIPANGNIDSVYKKVEIPDLSESIDEMQFMIGVTEKATGASAGQQGVPTDRQITLGEFKATLTESKGRIRGLSKFYTDVWKERGLMFIKLLEACPEKIDAVKVFVKGNNTNDIYSREISPKDWMSETGYRCKVWSQDEKEGSEINTLQKQNAVKQAMPNNPKVAEIYQRKLLEWAGYKPEEINEIMKYEQDQRDKILEASQAMMGGGTTTPAMPSVPVNPNQLVDTATAPVV